LLNLGLGGVLRELKEKKAKDLILLNDDSINKNKKIRKTAR